MVIEIIAILLEMNPNTRKETDVTETRVFPLADHIRVYRDGRIESCLTRGRWGGRGSIWFPVKINMGSHTGYPTVHIKMRGKHRVIGVHRVVAMAWLGEPNAGQVCRHKDDDRKNFHADNLEWGTHKENMEDAARNGRFRRGASHHVSKLTDDQREMIRISAAINGDVATLAKEFGVTTCAAHYVAYGRDSDGSATELRKEGLRGRTDWKQNWDCPGELREKKQDASPARTHLAAAPAPEPERFRAPTPDERAAYLAARPGRGNNRWKRKVRQSE